MTQAKRLVVLLAVFTCACSDASIEPGETGTEGGGGCEAVVEQPTPELGLYRCYAEDCEYFGSDWDQALGDLSFEGPTDLVLSCTVDADVRLAVGAMRIPLS